MKRMRNFILGMLLTTLLISCQSPKIEYVEKTVVPPLSFPVFPEPSEWATRDKANRSVTIPEDWYVQIAEFENDYRGLLEEYERKKALYEGEEIEK